MKKKILFFTGAMGRGGAERVITLLSESYISQGWDVAIGMVLHDIVEYDIPNGVKLIPVASSRGKIGVFETCLNIKKLVDKFDPTVIVSFLAPVCVLVDFSIGRRKKCPILMSERIDPSMAKRNKLLAFAINKAYSHSDCFIVQTKKARDYFSDLIKKKSIIIPNPIRVECERVENVEKRIVTAGRLVEQKNHKLLIEAFSMLHEIYPEYKLEIYGKGELRETLIKQIQTLNLSKNVFLKGTVSNLHEEISTADIFVLSSNYEGLSNAFLEAMLMGFPVISTDCAGANEYIISGENGIITPVGDRKALFEAMKLLIENPSLKSTIGKNAKKSVSHVRVENIINNWRSIIDSTIENFNNK